MADIKSIQTYRRRILLVTCFIGHCLYYVTRKSTTYSIPILLNDPSLRLSKDDFGIMASIQMTTYTIGKFMTGLLVDRVSCKRIFCFGLFCCGVVNVGFGFVFDRQSFFALTFLNGLFQAFGWNAIAVLVNKWYSKDQVGGIWSLLSSTINIGTSITPFIIMFITQYQHWRSAFIFIGNFTFLFALFAYFTIHDYEEVSQTKEVTKTKSEHESKETSSSFPLKVLVTSLVFWTISTCYALWSMVKGGTEDWLQLYLIMDRNMTDAEASFHVMMFQIGGFVASLFSGSLSDRVVVKYGEKMRGNPRLLLIIFASTTSIVWFYFLQFVRIQIISPVEIKNLLETSTGQSVNLQHNMTGDYTDHRPLFAPVQQQYLIPVTGETRVFSQFLVAHVSCLFFIGRSKYYYDRLLKSQGSQT